MPINRGTPRTGWTYTCQEKLRYSPFCHGAGRWKNDLWDPSSPCCGPLYSAWRLPIFHASIPTFVHNLSFNGAMPLAVFPYDLYLRWENSKALYIWVFKSVLKFACLPDNVHFKHRLLSFQMCAKVIREVTRSLLLICCFYLWEINILARNLIGLFC